GIAAARDAEVICFSDANSRYEPDTCKKLAAVFADPRVGAACGRLRLLGTDQSGTAAGEGLYWRYEDMIKTSESLSGTMLMGAGTLYAARRELIPDVPAHRADDSIVPLTVATLGYQVAWVPEAVAWERTAVDTREEFRRKVRMIAHDFGGYFYLKGCWKRPSVGLRLLCHKLLRWLVPVFYLAALGLAVPQSLSGVSFMLIVVLILGGGLVWGLLAWWAMSRGWRPKTLIGRLLALPGHFVMVNTASLFGICRSVFRGSEAAWEAAPSSHKGLNDDAPKPRPK
ncbi:glycosyltransferase, partial [bacterium]|nr:glycosyltransferase [bacterium]